MARRKATTTTLNINDFFNNGILLSAMNAVRELDFNLSTSRKRLILNRLNQFNKFNFNWKLGAGILVIIGLIFIIVNYRKATTTDAKIEVKDAKAVYDINQDYSFPLKNDEGEEVSRISYFIEKAELRDEIVVSGKRATAVKGRTFLILTVKISNQYDKPIEMDTKDYVRLVVDSNYDEKLAPDNHNDPVTIQAISTKYTRVGFPIDDGKKDLKLLVGEIAGEKQEIKLDF